MGEAAASGTSLVGDEATSQPAMQLISTMKRRRKKMNKHKLRKRRKKDRYKTYLKK